VRVGILGGGRWGQALARLVLAAGNEPFLAYEGARPPHMIPSTDVPPRVTEACDLILVAVSASRLREVIRAASPHPGNRVVIAGRGLEPRTGVWLSDVVLQECDAVRVGALGGPAPADEILNGGLCAGVVASEYDEVGRLTTEALHSTRYRVYASTDLRGVQLVGAAVPVLAALMGLSQALQGSGSGLQAMVLSRGLAEIGRLARSLGSDEATLWGLAGIGDLVAVHGKPKAAFFEAGANLARGRRDEGPWGAAEALSALAKKRNVETPLLDGLLATVAGGDPLDLVQRLMSRRSAKEHR